MALEPATNPQFNTQQRATDWEIDQLVYQLHGLTAAEIRIVEEETAH